ncbi:MAG: zinc-dependent alcohol dehydrogenase [Thermovirgaceae bacterium]
MKTRAALVDQPGRISIVEKEISCAPDEVMVKNTAIGICGSDKNIFCGKMPPSTTEFRHPPTYPFPLGHESGGEIVEIGRRVNNFNIGDRVISFGWNNNFADYFTAKEWQLQPAPESFNERETALGEPTACAVFSAMNAGIRLGDVVTVIGCGFAGQVIVQCAKKMGASMVIAVDPSDAKRKVAKRFGADVVLHPEDDICSASGKVSSEAGSDVVVECAGSESSMNLASEIVARNGRIVLYSWITEPVRLNISRWHDDGISIVTTCLVHHTWHERYVWAQKALRPVEQKILDIMPYIEVEFRLDEIQRAFEHACSGKEEAPIKTLILP